jgi:hypothetical protein
MPRNYFVVSSDERRGLFFRSQMLTTGMKGETAVNVVISLKSVSFKYNFTTATTPQQEGGRGGWTTLTASYR